MERVRGDRGIEPAAAEETAQEEGRAARTRS